VAAMAPSEESRDFARRFHIPLVTSDAAEIFGNPDIDAVIICSSTNTHADYVMQAAAAGKAIFCEKPLDLSVDKVRQTLNAVSKAKVPLMLALIDGLIKIFPKQRTRLLREILAKSTPSISSAGTPLRRPFPSSKIPGACLWI
jgi:myo-inositol 2-dehydrogenase / D-chiro-inositol 1-dehydrogenase